MGMIHEEEELFTTAEAAKELQVHQSTVRKLAKERILSLRRKPGKLSFFFTADSVRAYKEARHLKIRDLATRLLLLEQKMEMFIATQTTARDDEMLSEIAAVFEKNHPHHS